MTSAMSRAGLLTLALLLAGCDDDGPTAVAPSPAQQAPDLDTLCAERVASTTESAAIEAQERVDGIAGRLAEREAELTRLEAEMRNDDKRAKASAAERSRLQDEIKGLKGTLSQAEKTRDDARAELVATLKQLDAQIEAAAQAREDAEHQRARAQRGEWSAFVSDAKTRICDRGTRKRHARCHEAVEGALAGPMRGRFEACTASEQAVPELRRLEKGDELPEFAERIADDRAFTTKGWAVVFCDPALPETE